MSVHKWQIKLSGANCMQAQLGQPCSSAEFGWVMGCGFQELIPITGIMRRGSRGNSLVVRQSRRQSAVSCLPVRSDFSRDARIRLRTAAGFLEKETTYIGYWYKGHLHRTIVHFELIFWRRENYSRTLQVLPVLCYCIALCPPCIDYF